MKHRSILFAVAIALAASSAASTASAQIVYTRKSVNPSGYLGIRFEEIVQRNGERSTERIMVREVSKDSPAAKAGIQAGDELIRINGLVAGNGKFSAIAGTLVEGDTVRLRVKREGRERDFTMIAAARPAGLGPSGHYRDIIISGDSVRGLMRRYLDSARVHLDSLRLPNARIRVIPGDSTFFRMLPHGSMLHDSLIWKYRDSTFMHLFKSAPGDRLRHFEFDSELGPASIFHSIELGNRSVAGAEFSEMTPELAQYFNGQRGLLTLRVVPETPADRAGLQGGDVVLKAKDRSVQTVADLRAIVAANPDGVKLEISRKGKAQVLEFRATRR